VSASAFVLVDAILPIGNHTISEYLRLPSLYMLRGFGAVATSLSFLPASYPRRESIQK
jgi:hypothetical protein